MHKEQGARFKVQAFSLEITFLSQMPCTLFTYQLSTKVPRWQYLPFLNKKIITGQAQQKNTAF